MGDYDRDGLSLWKIAYIDEKRDMIGIYCVENTGLSTEILLCVSSDDKYNVLKLYQDDPSDVLFEWVETRDIEGEEYKYYFQWSEKEYLDRRNNKEKYVGIDAVNHADDEIPF